MAVQYFNNKVRWDMAFSYLYNTDLENIKVGTYYLDSTNLYAIVLEYMTKDLENTRFEAHRKYADIQYLIYGEEKIGVVETKEIMEVTPYDESKDIGFYFSENNNFRLVNPGKAFVFFPDNAHRPGVKTNNFSAVKKIVIKVRVN